MVLTRLASWPSRAPTPAGGAGIQADVKTMLALAWHGMTVVSAVRPRTRSACRATGSCPRTRSGAAPLGAQRHRGPTRSRPHAGPAEIVAAISDELAATAAPVIVDPVAVSKHGDRLLSEGTLDMHQASTAAAAAMVTPNLLEASCSPEWTIKDRERHARAARIIGEMGPRWCSLRAATCPVVRWTCWWAGAPRSATRASGSSAGTRHGTGFALASAIASRLALGDDVPDAVGAAKEFVAGAIAGRIPPGGGIGPVDHGWQISAASLRSGQLRSGPAYGAGQLRSGHSPRAVLPCWGARPDAPEGHKLRSGGELPAKIRASG